MSNMQVPLKCLTSKMIVLDYRLTGLNETDVSSVSQMWV